jgi:hypothetical protein
MTKKINPKKNQEGFNVGFLFNLIRSIRDNSEADMTSKKIKYRSIELELR